MANRIRRPPCKLNNAPQHCYYLNLCPFDFNRLCYGVKTFKYIGIRQVLYQYLVSCYPLVPAVTALLH